jgi:hypothetical protein
MKVNCKEVEHKSYTTECSIDNYCCKKMKQVLTYKKKRDSMGGDESSAFHMDRCGIDIPIHQDWDGITKRDYIRYCPFCGDEIE